MKFNSHLQIKEVQLIALSTDIFESLVQLAQNKMIWQHYAEPFNESAVFKERWLETAWQAMMAHERFVYGIFVNHQLVGSSSYYHIDTKNNSLDIGYTWLHPTFWGTKVNFKAKYLLLKQVFEDFSQPVNRVGFWVDDRNQRSCKAVKKIGAQYEGTLRNHMVRADNTLRHSAVFSILLTEWPTVKANFELMG